MRRSLAFVALVGVVVGCTRDQWHRFPSPDDLIAAVPWFSVMHRGLAVQPYKMPRMPVEGTVPITGVELFPNPTPQSRAELGRLRNPMSRTAASLERGQDRYEIHCRVCHGDGGQGDGPVADKVIGIRDLTIPTVRSATDGWLYAVATRGFGLMPEYGSKLSPEDRWHIVNYVRVLQGAAQ